MTPYDLNIYFETVIKFGTDKQPLNLVADTGSSWTWVLTDECIDLDDCVDHNSYHHLMSDTFQTTQESKKITYGDRVTEGQICTENARLDTSDDLFIEEFPIIKVDEKQDDDDQFSGIVGLSPKDDSAGPLFIDYLFNQGQIDRKQFSILIQEDINDES